MTIKRGSTAVSKVYRGSTLINRLYRGATLVFDGSGGGGGPSLGYDPGLTPPSAAVTTGGWSMNAATGVGTGVNAHDSLYWPSILTIGTTYNFTMEYAKTSGSRLWAYSGSGAGEVFSPALGASGTFSGSFVAGSGTFRIRAADMVYNGTVARVVVTAA